MDGDPRTQLERVLGPEAEALPRPFDPTDDLHLECAAGPLLARFRERDDVEAYVLLVELCQARLRQLATGITRRLAVMIDADDLVAGFMARLFTDVQATEALPGGEPVRRFLSLAYAMMRYDCLNQLRLLRRASVRDARFEQLLAFERRPLDPAVAADARDQGAALARIGTLLLVVVSRCFHALGTRDRRVLICREIEQQSYDELAATLGLPRPQVGMILKRARERLAQRLEQALARPVPASVPESTR